METKQLYKGYRRIVQGWYKDYHTSKPKKSKILNLDQSETSVRGLEHCSQVSSTYYEYFEYVLIWERNLAGRPFNSCFLFSHLKILQEKVNRKNNKKTHHAVQPSTLSSLQPRHLSGKSSDIHLSKWYPTKAGGVSILSSTVQTRSNTKYHLIEGLSIVNIFHHPKIACVGEVLSSNHPDHYSLYRSLFCHPIDDAGRRFFGRLFMDNIRVFGVRIDRLFQNLEKALHIFASTSWTYMTPHESMNTYIYQLALGQGFPCKKSTNIGSKNKQQTNRLPSRELTYPPKMAFWRWFSFSQGGTC